MHRFENVYTATFSDQATRFRALREMLCALMIASQVPSAAKHRFGVSRSFRSSVTSFFLVGHQRQVAPHRLESLHICFRRSLLMHNMELIAPRFNPTLYGIQNRA